MVTGDADLWEYVGAGERPDDWEPVQSDSLQTQRLDELLGSRLGEAKAYYYASEISVTEAVFDPAAGDLSLHLSDGCRLSVFPNASRGEQWRLFSPGQHGPHFVFELP